MTQSELDRALHYSDTSVIVHMWERRRKKVPSEMIPEICDVLDCTPNQLFGFSDKTIEDFSTDDILEELRRRISNSIQ